MMKLYDNKMKEMTDGFEVNKAIMEADQGNA